MSGLKVNTLEELLRSLDRIEFDNAEGETLTNENWKVVIISSFMLDRAFKGGVQLKLHIRFNGSYVCTWGAEDDQANIDIIRWFEAKKAAIRHMEMEREDRDQERGLAYLNEIA